MKDRSELPTNDAWHEFDWEECFAETATSGDYEGTFDAKQNRVEDVAVADIAEVVAFEAHDPDEPSMCCLARLQDGRWATCGAWTDYTGWGCRASAVWHVFDTREQAERLGLTDDERRLLGITP